MNHRQGTPADSHKPALLEMTPLEHLRHLRARWRRVVALGFLSSLVGVIVALVLDPVYQSNATIRPRDGAQASLLGFGNLTGQPNSQLVKIEGFFKSRDLALDLLETHPEFLGWLYPKNWDSVSGRWKQGENPPARLKQAGELQRRLVINSSIREGTLTAQFKMNDPHRAQIMLAAYIERLNHAMRRVERQDADSNRAFMERELLRTEDPALRLKMQALIASELERSYLMRNRAFEVVEAPAFFEQKLSPHRRKIVVGFLAGGLLLGVGFAYAGLLLGWTRHFLQGGKAA